MKRLIPFLSALALLAACTVPPVDEAAVSKAVRQQMQAWPESRLQDLYKSFFQDRFGPGHIITDRASALDYILSELAETGASDAPYTEPCGWEENYVRVSLSAIRDGLVSADALTDALMQSADPVTEEAIAAWKKEWKAILSVIEAQCPDLPGLQRDKHALDSLLRSGQYACHHSPAYERAYSPHYRIVRKELAASLLQDDSSAPAR